MELNDVERALIAEALLDKINQTEGHNPEQEVRMRLWHRMAKDNPLVTMPLI
jgi:hypothetical protein